MKSYKITIDINKLTADQLEQLQTMAYQLNDAPFLEDHSTKASFLQMNC